MSLSPEIRAKLEREIEALHQRLRIDSNDLEYETHLRRIRDYKRILAASAQRKQPSGTEANAGAQLAGPADKKGVTYTMKDTTKAAVLHLIERYPALQVCQQDLLDAVEAIIASYRKGKKLITCGNGGSAADAEHIVGELMKGFLLKRKLSPELYAKMQAVCPAEADYFYENLQGTLPALSLMNQVALNSAFANDQAPDLAMAQQILGMGDEGDSLLAISTSGNSTNVIYAVQMAKVKGVKTIALTGRKGGKLKGLADITICVPDDETYRIQELHLPVYHMLCIAVENEFFGA